jgi:hypothetical protein
MNVRRLLSLLVLASVAVTARAAHAVCMGSQGYRVSPQGSTVLVVLDNVQRRRCPDPGGLLRQNLDTGAIVKIDACSGTDAFIDECVPQGRYRYGLAVPYDCCEVCCKTEYFVEYTAPAAPPANCDATRMPDKPRPVPHTMPAPWGATAAICAYVPPDAGRPSTPGGGPRANLDAAPAPGSGGTPPPGAPAGNVPTGGQASGGCSVGGGSGSAALLILAGLVLALGFVRTAERRQRRP